MLTLVNSNVFAVHATKAYGGMDVQLNLFPCLALIGSKWPVLRPGRFTSAERPRILGRPQGRAVDVLEKKNISPAQASNHGSFVIQPVAIPS